MKYLKNIGIKAKKAFENLKRVEHRRIQKTLKDYSGLLKLNESKIIKENLKDLKKIKRKNLIDRLILNQNKIHGIQAGLKTIQTFKNPVGQVLSKWKRPNKLWIEKVRGLKTDQIEKVLGYASKSEIIHRDDMVKL